MGGGQKAVTPVQPLISADYGKASVVAASTSNPNALSMGANSTILTSGLGDPNSATIGKKGMLGV